MKFLKNFINNIFVKKSPAHVCESVGHDYKIEYWHDTPISKTGKLYDRTRSRLRCVICDNVE